MQVSVLIGYALAVLLLALCVRRRNGAVAWVLAVAAVVSALLVSVRPVVAVGLSGAGQVQDLVPFLQDLVERVLAR